MATKFVNIIAVAVIATVFTGSAAQAAPAPLEQDQQTASFPMKNSLRGDIAETVANIDTAAKRYAKESERMADRVKAAGDKYEAASIKFKKLADTAVKLKAEAKTAKTASALTKVRQKKTRMHMLATAIYRSLQDEASTTS